MKRSASFAAVLWRAGLARLDDVSISPPPEVVLKKDRLSEEHFKQYHLSDAAQCSPGTDRPKQPHPGVRCVGKNHWYIVVVANVGHPLVHRIVNGR